MKLYDVAIAGLAAGRPFTETAAYILLKTAFRAQLEGKADQLFALTGVDFSAAFKRHERLFEEARKVDPDSGAAVLQAIEDDFISAEGEIVLSVVHGMSMRWNIMP